MRKLGILIILLAFFVRPVFADEFTAPTAPDAAKELLPVETKSFSEDLWMIIQEAISRMHPELMAAAGLCTGLFAITIAVSVIQSMPGNTANMVRLVAALTVATLLLQQTGSLIRSAAETIQELSEYGKLLLPAMAAATAAQGGIRTSTAVYAGTAIFNTLLCSAIKLLLIPMIYILPIVFGDSSFAVNLSSSVAHLCHDAAKTFCVFLAEPVADITAATVTTLTFVQFYKTKLKSK